MMCYKSSLQNFVKKNNKMLINLKNRSTEAMENSCGDGQFVVFVLLFHSVFDMLKSNNKF